MLKFTVRLLGSRPVTAAFRRSGAPQLRVLAYHDVRNRPAFEAHLAVLTETYQVVSSKQVAEACAGRLPLPPRAVWITFDDGHAGVMQHGLPALRHFDLPATMFVCPGVIDTTTPYWWQIVDLSLDADIDIIFDGRTWHDRRIVTRLKSAPDTMRRSLVGRLHQELTGRGILTDTAQITTADLVTWRDAGHSIGNHTWDHPCLDTCSDDVQHEQIVQAHEWLRPWVDDQELHFAYPNGNETSTATNLLRDLGYSTISLFDHRVCTRLDRRLSRLRLDADAPLPRARAVISGAHSAAFHLAHPNGGGLPARRGAVADD